jgi:hypothetical protein
MPLSPSATSPRSAVDEDLQKLYNDVLAGFDTEVPSLSLNDNSGHAHTYGDYGDASHNGNRDGDVYTPRSHHSYDKYTPTSPASVLSRTL